MLAAAARLEGVGEARGKVHAVAGIPLYALYALAS